MMNRFGGSGAASRKRVRRDEQGGGPPRKRGRGPLTQEEMADGVKTGQRASKAYGDAWKRWANAQPYSPGLDPALWSPEELRNFYHDIGEYFVSGDCGPSGPPSGRPPVGRYPPKGRRLPRLIHPEPRPRRRLRPTFSAPRKRPPPRPRPPMKSESELSNFGINHKDAEGKIVCFDWLNGRCRFGDTCKFSHRGSAGERGVCAPPASPMMVKFIKHGQAVSEDFKVEWSRFTMDHGGGTRDPRKHEIPFFIGFLLCFGVEKLASEGWALEYQEELMEKGRPILVAAIKKVQSDTQAAGSWDEYCDSSRGSHDPERHEPGSLLQFMEQIGVKNYGEKGLMELLFDSAASL